MAAYEAARAGLNTIILEKDRDIGYPVRCGEAVGEDGLRMFMEPEPQWIAATLRRVRLHSPKNTILNFEIPKRTNGLILHRRLFDYALAQRAAMQGAQVQTRAYVDGLQMSDKQVTGVTYQYFGERRTLSAKIVIGADGVESRVGRMAGLRTSLKLGDTESGYQVTVANVEVDQDLIEFYVGKNWAPGGYLWVFPKGNGVANIGLGIEGNYTRELTAKDLLEKFLKEYYPQAAVLTAVAGGIPVAKTLKRITAGGLMLVGDAARMVNPISGGGIISGMLGGKIAGEVAAKAVGAGDVSVTGLKDFPDRWHKEAGQNYERIHRISKSVREITDEQFEEMAMSLKHVPIEKMTGLKVFTTAARYKPKILFDVTRAFAGI